MLLWLQRWTGLLLMVVVSFRTCGQAKIYFAGGMSNAFGSGVNIFLGTEGSFFKFNYPAFDAEYQTRLIGSFNFVSGVSVFGSG